MARDPLNIVFRLLDLKCYNSGESGLGGDWASPYLWVVYCKIDGETVSLAPSGLLAGTATVITTPGSHGNLGVSKVYKDNVVPIPLSLGGWHTILRPIPFVGGSDLPAIAGVFVILMEQDNLSDGEAEAGHQALNQAVQSALDGIIATNQIPGPAEIDRIKTDIANKVRDAVVAKVIQIVDLWAATDPDDKIGATQFFFDQNELASRQSIDLSARWQNEGDWELIGNVRVVFPKRRDGDIFRFDGNRFVQVPGALAQVAVARRDEVWGVNSSSDVFRFNPLSGRFDAVPGAPKLEVIAVANAETQAEVMGINALSDIFRLNPATRQFDQIPGKLEQLHVWWGLNPLGEAFSFDRRTNSFRRVPGGELVMITSIGWGCNRQSEVFVGGLARFDKVPGRLTTISGDTGEPWGLYPSPQQSGLVRSNDIFKFNLGAGIFEQIPGDLMTLNTSGQSVWGLSAFHEIFRFNWNTEAFEQIPGSLDFGLSVAFDGDVWGLRLPVESPH